MSSYGTLRVSLKITHLILRFHDAVLVRKRLVILGSQLTGAGG